jgi:hypothetical protein
MRTIVCISLAALLGCSCSSLPAARSSLDQRIQKRLQPNLDIRGKWMRGGGFSRTYLTITSTQAVFHVAMDTSGCLGEWQESYRGTFQDAVLTLDRNMNEYDSFDY